MCDRMTRMSVRSVQKALRLCYLKVSENFTIGRVRRRTDALESGSKRFPVLLGLQLQNRSN